MKKNKVFCFLFVLCFLLAGSVIAEAGPKIISIQLYADWSPTTEMMAVAYNPIKIKYKGGDGGIKFVVFDRSNDKTKRASRKMAAKLGIKHLYDKFPGTGKVLIVDAATKKLLGIFDKEDSAYSMMEFYEHALEGKIPPMERMESLKNAQTEDSTEHKGSMHKGSMMKGS